ncbi:pyridoxine/pyridoxamine 5'-phosphate oxidase [Cellulomonas citrea]|uniref:pyridoxine/pyridoxamine 5'-phosphate oxidase n=1 Tax=Cellulomonas citrea TaxID=1909423 RepID=UPI00135C066F|nr:pyridoxamine 5'-phosphate oxidase family protein [Cellulomonas citrea]
MSEPQDDFLLDAATAPESPLALLAAWAAAAVAATGGEPSFGTLATVGPAGAPSTRVIQLLEVEPETLLFTTNFGSRKGVEMAANPHVAYSLWWPAIARSVNLTGTVEYADEAENDARFAADPLLVQAARTVSFHGRPLTDEPGQQRRLDALVAAGEPLPRPDYWGWFRLRPDSATFWQANPEGVNRRVHYAWAGDAWSHGAVQA